jgi:transposase, IS6 family
LSGVPGAGRSGRSHRPPLRGTAHDHRPGVPRLPLPGRGHPLGRALVPAPWHVDETYVRVGGSWRYLYRAVDGTGQTIDFLLSAKRDKKAAQRFFRRALARENTRNPRTIVTDRLKSYPGALRGMKRAGELWRFTRHRRGRWRNNRVEQDHRRIKRLTRPMLGFASFWTARRTLAGVEAMAMLLKGQVRAVPANDMPAQRSFVHQVFGLAA